MKRETNSSLTRWISLGILFFAVIATMGCAPESPKPKEFDSSVKGPQMIVEPDQVRLGIATFLGTKIVFRGREFDSEEKIMIVLSGDDEANKEVSIPFCFGKTDKDGSFTAEVNKREKIINVLRADFKFGKKGASVVISEPPIPLGNYKAEAVGYKSDKKATCRITLVKPSLVDRIKDFAGGVLGKIEHEEGIQSE